MKYKLIPLLLAALLLAGCTKPADTPASTVAEEPQTFGVSNLDAAPEPMAGVTTQPDSTEDSTSAEEVPFVPPTPDERVLLSALVAEYEAGLSYDPADPLYFWRAVSLLMGQVGTVDDGHVRMTEAELAPLVTALFGDQAKPYPSLGEENPWVTETFEDGGSVYTAVVPGPLDYTLSQSGLEPREDGTYLGQVELLAGRQYLASYSVTLRDFPESEGDSQEFSRCIETVERE